MKNTANLILILILAFAFSANADNMSSSSSSTLGRVVEPPPFQLMDLTELLNSLNVTYEQLAQNLNDLNSSISSSPTASNTNTPQTSTNQQSPAQTQTQTPPSYTQSTSTQTIDSKPTKPSNSASTVTNPPTTTQSTVKTSNNSQSSTPTQYSQTSTYKPDSISQQSSKPTEKPQTTKPTSTQTQASTTTGTTSSGKPSSTSSNTASTAQNSSSNVIPTYGPGPTDKSLPPVIDITKLVVDTPAPSANNISSQSQQSTNTQSSSSSSVSPTKTTPNTSQSPNQQKPTTNLQTNTPPASDSATKNTKPTTSGTSQTIPSNTYNDNTSQNNPNVVYLPPVVTNTPTSSTSNPISSNNLAQSDDSTISAYQSWIGSKDAVYSITPSYKSFSKYFIISKSDANLPNITSYLIGNYGNYLSGSQVVAGFRMYNSNGDNSFEYQLLYSTNYGTFVSILTYWPDTGSILLKSLSILNFFIMEVDYSNCQVQDLIQQNCKTCKTGFRNFLGRCQSYDPSCIDYITDECGKCSKGKTLSNGVCQ